MDPKIGGSVYQNWTARYALSPEADGVVPGVVDEEGGVRIDQGLRI